MSENQSSHDLATWMAQLLDRKGARGIVVLDVSNVSTITNFMVIASGTSLKHMETLISAPCQELKKSGNPAFNVEGEGTTWVVADFSDVVLHVFDEYTRQYYDLETLWNVGKKVDWEKKQSTLSMAL